MNKMKKAFSIVLGAALAASTMPFLTTEAVWDERYAGVMTDLYTPPEGYEVFEDTELYQNYGEYFDVGAIQYRSIENRQFFAGYYYFEFSKIDLTVTGDGWEEIYNKYSEVLGMDSVKRLTDSNYVRIMDCINVGSEVYEDAGAEIQKRYNAIEEKFDTLMTMCSEMYEAGCIESAEYTPFNALAQAMCTDAFYVFDYAGTQEELEAAVTTACEEAIVRTYVRTTEPFDTYYSVVFAYDGASAEDYFTVVDAVRAIEGEHTVDVDIVVQEEGMSNPVPSLGGGVVDIIALLEMESNIPDGDVNADGTTDITDAVLILQHYAESAASSVAAVSETNMDVNGDGSVDLDDASAVLQIYAENAAGV